MSRASASGLTALVGPLDLGRIPSGSLRSRGLTSLVGLAAQGLVRLLVAVVVGRLAGPAVLGIVAAGLATAQFLILLWPTTSGQAASRFLARARGRRAPEEVAQAAAHLEGRVIVATVVLAALSVPFSLWRGLDPFGAACVALLLAGLAGQQFTRGIHYGVGAVTRVVVLDVAFSLLGLLGVVVALLAGVRSAALLLPLALAYLGLTLACRPRGLRRGAPRGIRREIDRFVAFGSVGTLASAGLVQVSVLVADGLGPEAAGRYAAASNLALPLTLVSGAMSLVLYPTMAEAFGRGDTAAVARQLDQGVRGLVFATVPVLVTLVVAADLVVRLVYGPGFTGSGPVFALLVGAVVVSMVGVPCVNALTSGGQHGIVVMAGVSLAGLLSAVIVWAVLLPGAGLLGVAAGYATGVGLIALVAVTAAWWRWRPAWAATAAWLFGILAAAAAWRMTGPDLPAAGQAAVILIFCAVWLVVRPRERRLWWGLLRRR